MNTAMKKGELEQILDQALQDVTERTAGVRLCQGDLPLGEDLCTVHITFDKGFGTSLISQEAWLFFNAKQKRVTYQI